MDGSGKDHTVDSFVSQDDAMDPDLPDTPRLTKYFRFHPKIKGKAKVGSSYDPPVEAVAIHGAKPSTVLSSAGLCSDGTEQEVGDSTEVDDRDDIVREISVFCGSGNLGEDTQLYVMQQVLREAWRPYELNNRCEEIRLDPNQLKIEVDLRFERDDGNSDQEISKPLNLQKQTLSSTVVSSSVQYAVGFLEKNKFHLNPVHAVLQLRPSFASLHDDFIKKTFVSETAEASTKAIKVIRELCIKRSGLLELKSGIDSVQLQTDIRCGWSLTQYRDTYSFSAHLSEESADMAFFFPFFHFPECTKVISKLLL